MDHERILHDLLSRVPDRLRCRRIRRNHRDSAPALSLAARCQKPETVAMLHRAFEIGGLTLADVPGANALALSEDFPMEEVYARLDGPDPQQTVSRDWEAAAAGLNSVLRWCWRPGKTSPDGLTCRSAVASWIFVPQLRGFTLTEVANRIGRKKQSLGRWVTDFKGEFPEVASHLRHLRHL